MANVAGGWWGFTDDQIELAGALIASVGGLAYVASRRATQRQLTIDESELHLLATQMPANVWTTDLNLQLTSVFGSLIARLENPAARVPGRTLYEIFQTRDETHPAIAAHLRALQGESAAYERVAGDLVVEGRVEPLRDGRGRIIGCVGTVIDVSTWRWAESQVRRLGALVQSSEDAIISTDLDGTIETWNPAAERLYGYTAAEVIGRPIAIVASPGGESEIERNTLALRQGTALGPYEARRLRRDGRAIEVSVNVSPIRDGSGRVVGMSGIVRDITDRKRAEEEVVRLASFPRMNPTPIVEMDTAGNVSFMNPEAERLFPDLRDAPSLHPFVAGAWALTGESRRAGRRLHSREVRVRETWYLQDIFALPDGSHLRIYASDITERRRAEEALRTSNTRFRELFNRMSSGVAVYEAIDNGGDFIFIDFNPAAERIEKVSREDILGKRVTEIFPGVKAFGVFEVFQRVWQTGEPEYFPGSIYRDERGLATWRESWVFKLPTGEIVAIYDEITERKRAEEALRQSATMFRLLTENATDIISRHAPDGTFLYVSPACRKLLGYDAEELVGRSPFEFIHPDDATVTTPPREVSDLPTGYSVTFRFRRKDGTYGWLESLGHTERDQTTGAVTEIHVVSRDVTGRMRVEGQMRQQGEELRALAQHLESAREEEHTRMAREIHDELAQSLTALRLDLSWLAKRVPGSGQAVRAKLAEMTALTDATIEAGRRIAAELRPPILDDLGLTAALDWYVQDFAKRTKLRATLEAGPKELVMDGRLAVTAYRIVQEALANVARHAEANRVTVRLGEQDGALLLEITDDGKGIRADASGDVRSFGIVGMRERAAAHGGALEVASPTGGGTVVRATIPLERRQAARGPA